MKILHRIPEQARAPVALTIGNFDGVHLGHQAMIRRLTEAARGLGIASCVMTFEPHPREFFAPDQAPTRLSSLREKLELLAELGVDRAQVVRFNFDFAKIGAEDFITRIVHRGLQARWVLVGDDFRFGARRAGDLSMLREQGRRLGFDVFAMSSVLVDGLRISSTAIRDSLAAGDLATARTLLGRPYSISGRVVDGHKLGTRIGFPTANIQMKHNRPPLTGIFAVDVEGADRDLRQGVASLGVRPTVHTDGRPILEVHLFDFDRQLYGRHLRVRFLGKLREEEKFPDLDSLRRQIARDVENAKAFFKRTETEGTVQRET